MIGLLLLAGAAGLCIAAWWQIRARNQARLAAMEQREEELADTPDAFRWEEHVEDPDAWKGEERDDDDDDGDDDLVGVR